MFIKHQKKNLIIEAKVIELESFPMDIYQIKIGASTSSASNGISTISMGIYNSQEKANKVFLEIENWLINHANEIYRMPEN